MTALSHSDLHDKHAPGTAARRFTAPRRQEATLPEAMSATAGAAKVVRDSRGARGTCRTKAESQEAGTKRRSSHLLKLFACSAMNKFDTLFWRRWLTLLFGPGRPSNTIQKESTCILICCNFRVSGQRCLPERHSSSRLTTRTYSAHCLPRMQPSSGLGMAGIPQPTIRNAGTQK